MRFVKMVACPRDGGLKPYFFDAVVQGDSVVPGPRHGCVDVSDCPACARCWRSVLRSVFQQKRRSARPARPSPPCAIGNEAPTRSDRR